MHLEVLVEEPSAKVALDILIPKIIGEDHTFVVHPFRGRHDLLKELPSRLRGYAGWMPSHYRIAVLIDEDRHDCIELKSRLTQTSVDARIEKLVLSRIVVEELEAWFFGDFEALRTVYPRLPATLPRRKGFRDPDSIAGGTWEALDRALRKAGYSAGLAKIRNARDVATEMDPIRNTSRSFQVFRSGLLRLVRPDGDMGA